MAQPKRGHFSRSRSLADFNKRFGKDALQRAVRRAQRRSRKVRVLEVGCGEGRVLLELQKQFPEAEIHGINKRPWPAMRGAASLRRTATYFKVYSAQELKRRQLPRISFYDAEKLRFPTGSVDVIYSQVAIHYIARKDRFLEEAWRVLKPGGEALLHVDTRWPTYPDFLQFPTPRCIIYRDGGVVTLGALAKRLRAKGFDIRVRLQHEPGKDTRTFVLLRKNTTRALRLGLVFDELSSFSLWSVEQEKRHLGEGLPYWGYRSVYRLR